MNKPGEYVPVNPNSFCEYEQNENGFTGIGIFKTDAYESAVVAAVEKAHAERCCGNCGVGTHSDNSAMWCNKHYIEITDSGTLKCNEWESKEEKQ